MIRGVLTVVTIGLFAPLTGAQLAQPRVPTLVLYNAKVITVDPAFSIAEAVAISGDRLMAVGTSARMRAIAAPSTRMVDLRGQTLIPGLMDNHLHGAGGGPGVDVSRARSLAEVTAAIAARVKTSAPGDVTVSNSDWHEAQLKERACPAPPTLWRRSSRESAPDPGAFGWPPQYRTPPAPEQPPR